VLVAGAVCPHPPLLIPAAAGSQLPRGDDVILDQVRTACRAAVTDLIRTEPDLIVVVGGAEASAVYAGSAAGSLREFGIPFVTGSGPPVLPLSLTVGAWLLRGCRAAGGCGAAGGRDVAGGHYGTASDRASAPGGGAGTDPELRLHAVAIGTPTADCLRLGARLAGAAPRVAMLAMGDGSARRATGVPGAPDPAADRYDAEVAGAFADADTGRLARLDPALDDPLAVAGRAAWQVLAGAARGCEVRGTLRCAVAPFDVSYLVASWVCVPSRAADTLMPCRSQ